MMESPNRLALQLNAEITAVLTAMRQNAKWAVVPGSYNVRGAEGPGRCEGTGVMQPCSFPFHPPSPPPHVAQEEDHMEPEPHYEEFRSLRRKVFEWEGECRWRAARSRWCGSRHALRPAAERHAAWGARRCCAMACGARDGG